MTVLLGLPFFKMGLSCPTSHISFFLRTLSISTTTSSVKACVQKHPGWEGLASSLLLFSSCALAYLIWDWSNTARATSTPGVSRPFASSATASEPIPQLNLLHKLLKQWHATHCCMMVSITNNLDHCLDLSNLSFATPKILGILNWCC